MEYFVDVPTQGSDTLPGLLCKLSYVWLYSIRHVSSLAAIQYCLHKLVPTEQRCRFVILRERFAGMKAGRWTLSFECSFNGMSSEVSWRIAIRICNATSHSFALKGESFGASTMQEKVSLKLGQDVRGLGVTSRPPLNFFCQSSHHLWLASRNIASLYPACQVHAAASTALHGSLRPVMGMFQGATPSLLLPLSSESRFRASAQL
jgi:hypothetical protein